MIAAATLIQSDPAVINLLERLLTTQIVVASGLAIIALAALAVAIGALFAVRKLTATINRSMTQFSPRLNPLIESATRLAEDAEDISASVKVRVADVLETVDDMNARLRLGVQSVEDRLKHFGTVVDVVQSETEGLLLDAASTARGVHSAAQVLRSGGHVPDSDLEEEDEDEVFTD